MDAHASDHAMGASYWLRDARRRRAVLELAALGFLVLVSYEIARPACDSLYIARYGQRGLPAVWLAVSIGTVLVTLFFNRFAARVRVQSLFVAAIAATVCLQALLLGAYAAGVPGAVFGLYVWKDIYVVVLVETFWIFANSVFDVRAARWLYGFFCVAGSVGSVTGGAIMATLAPRWGTLPLLAAVAPILLVAAVGMGGVARSYPLGRPAEAERANLAEGLRAVRHSRYLLLIIALVGASQVFITLVDYHYNGVIQAAYPDTDVRTGIMGRVNSALNGAALGLQLVSGPALLLFKIPGTLLLIPLLHSAFLLGATLWPAFATVAALKVVSKAFDYSWFRAAKEILYIPLGHVEKTQGKAFADIMTYRFAKGGTSVLLSAILLLGVGAESLVTALAFTFLAVWIGVTRQVWRRYHGRAEPSS